MSGKATNKKPAGDKAKGKSGRTHGVRGGSSEANRLAVAILEVLAGLRTPADAAVALGISLPRYYQLEIRALEGLISACEPRPLGKQPTLQGKITRLEQELTQVRHECARQQALVRVAQRSVGLKAAREPAQSGAKKASSSTRRKGRKRRPTVRALKAAEALRKNIRTSEPESLQPTAEQKAGAADARPQEGNPLAADQKSGSVTSS